jgi:beta-ribofuranosylaminobenzene 5'-phosphate synthase
MKIRITSSSRLHLGFMDLNGGLGRLYGSVGVSLSNPGTDITVKHHRHLSVQGTDKETKLRIIDCVNTFSEHYKTEPNVMVIVHESIPEHKGLGSGTQLALVVSTALAHLYGIQTNTYDLSMLMGRGMRSSIGIWGFEHGGLIIDSGIKKKKDRTISEPPKALITYDFPEEWKFVIAVPQENKGLSGKEEKEAIQTIDPPRNISEEICRLVMMKLLPSLLEKDIKNFGGALTEIDRNTGLFFKPVQGGIYSEKFSDKIIDHLLDSGAYGAGQSSWGPAIYGLTTAVESFSLAERMEDFMAGKKIKGDVIIASGRNQGAKIEIQKCEKKDSVYNANRNQVSPSLADSDLGSCSDFLHRSMQ